MAADTLSARLRASGADRALLREALTRTLSDGRDRPALLASPAAAPPRPVTGDYSKSGCPSGWPQAGTGII